MQFDYIRLTTVGEQLAGVWLGGVEIHVEEDSLQ